MTSMHPRLSVNDPFSAISPTPLVQPCLSVSLPEHYSSNVEPHKHDHLGIFSVVPAARLSHSFSASLLTYCFATYRKTTTASLPVKMISSSLSIIPQPKASMQTLTSLPLVFRAPRHLPAILLRPKPINSKEAH